MGIKNNIGKALLNGCWILVGLGILVLLIAAMQEKQGKRCTGIAVELVGEQPDLFLDTATVTAWITDQGQHPLKGVLIQAVDLGRLESRLKQAVWVAGAELYFDNKQILKVKVTERQPVARIFPVEGPSYYVDAQGNDMPLSGKRALRLPVFTGYPYPQQDQGDSARQLIARIIAISEYITAHPFWNAQVAQVAITTGKEFEVVPTLGLHVIEFGDGEQPGEKFRKLSLFYRQVLHKTGVDAYERIRVQYAGQVIGVRHSGNRQRYDGTEALRTVQRMIGQIREEQLASAREDSTLMPEVHVPQTTKASTSNVTAAVPASRKK